MSSYGDPIFDLLVSARVSLLFSKPFIGTLATRLKLVDATEWCNTAATDGVHFYYNREFIKSLDREQILFLCGHEVLHCVLDHLGRRGRRNPKLLNMAQDYVINYCLKKEKIGKMPEMGLYDPRFTDDMTSEEVYDILEKESVTIKMTLDEHMELGGDGDGGDGEGGEDGTFEVTIMGKGGKPRVSKEDMDRIRADLKAQIVQAAQQHADSVPAGVKRMIGDLIEPKLDWRSLLDSHIRSSLKDDFTFQRLSRRTSAMRYAVSQGGMSGMLGVPMMPTQDYQNTIDILVAIDTSGSMTMEMLRDQLSEVKGIMQTFRDFRLQILTFDTKVYNLRTYTGENIDEIDTYPMDGGGGTMFECVWEHMKRHGIEPHRLVMFTDGMPNSSWGDPDYVDTLFVIHTFKNIKAPFGITCYYDPKA